MASPKPIMGGIKNNSTLKQHNFDVKKHVTIWEVVRDL